MHLDWLWVITVVSVYFSTRKMLKETETEETIRCFVTFLSLVAFQLGGGFPPPFGYACDLR